MLLIIFLGRDTVGVGIICLELCKLVPYTHFLFSETDKQNARHLHLISLIFAKKRTRRREICQSILLLETISHIYPVEFTIAKEKGHDIGA